jgi:hypothetical protein
MGAVLLLALAACGGGKPSAKASASAGSTVDATAQLAAAVAKTAGQSFTFTVGEPNDNVTGQYDATAKAAKLTTPDSSDDIVTMGTDLWATVDKTVQHYDALKFAADDSMALLTDPTAALRFLPAASKVATSGGGAYRGIIDLSAVPAQNPATKHLAGMLAQRVGAAATAVPFTAKVDGQGRLTTVDLTLPKADNGKDADYQFVVTGFSIGAPVTRPTGQIVEAPDAAYRD